jgi:hypothetical protein
MKPIIFIYTEEMRRVYRDTIIKALKSSCEYLDASIFNIDDIKEGSQVMVREPNYLRYTKYKYDFLTTRESEHTSAAEIFLENL